MFVRPPTGKLSPRSRLAACRRRLISLPNDFPAFFHQEIEAPKIAFVEFDAVAPELGQSGGGVEAYFSNAVMNENTPPAPVAKLADE